MKESLYLKARTRLTRLKNTGFDYKGKLFRKSMSPLLFADPKRAEILDEYEKIMYFLVEKAKLIKTFYNYTVNKDYKNLN
jgi:hypothetical protein